MTHKVTEEEYKRDRTRDYASKSIQPRLTGTTADGGMVWVSFGAAEWALLWQAAIADGAPGIKDWIMTAARKRLEAKGDDT